MAFPNLNSNTSAWAWMWPSLPSAVTPAAVSALILVAVTFSRIMPGARNGVPELSDSIPFVANTFQYMTNTNKFLARAA